MSYETNFITLLKSCKDANIKSNKDTMFCSELCAYILNEQCIFRGNPSNCTPSDLQSSSGLMKEYYGEDLWLY